MPCLTSILEYFFFLVHFVFTGIYNCLFCLLAPISLYLILIQQILRQVCVNLFEHIKVWILPTWRYCFRSLLTCSSLNWLLSGPAAQPSFCCKMGVFLPLYYASSPISRIYVIHFLDLLQFWRSTYSTIITPTLKIRGVHFLRLCMYENIFFLS